MLFDRPSFITAATFFTAATKKIFQLKLRGKIQLFADDTCIAYGEKSLDDLKAAIESDLILIRNFFFTLKLDLNAEKTKYVLFYGRKRFQSFTERDLRITLGTVKIERVESYKCLGLIIDEKLSYDDHIEHVYKKCIGMVFAIRRIRNLITEKLAYQIYFAHIYSHLIFLNSLWSVTSKENVEKLFRMQKKCLKFIQKKDQLAPSSSLFSEKILPLPVMNDFNLLILAFKIKHNLIKNNVALTFVENIHNHGTRHSLSGNFYVVGHETQYGLADFYRRGLIKYNELPDEIKRLRTLSLFKKRIREHLFELFMGEN